MLSKIIFMAKNNRKKNFKFQMLAGNSFKIHVGTSSQKSTTLISSLQRFVKGITPNIISNRSKGPPRSVVKEMQMSESSARLLKNASFLTKNSSFTAENP